MRKRIIVLSLLIILLAASIVYATSASFVRHSGEFTASAIITPRSGKFHGILFTTDGTNTVTVSIYDNATAAAGNELIPTSYITSSAANRLSSISIDPPVKYHNGIYVHVAVAGGGAVSYMVYYEDDN